MKFVSTLLVTQLLTLPLVAQTPIQSVTTQLINAPTSYTYNAGGDNYYWGKRIGNSNNANRKVENVDNFTAGNKTYGYTNVLNGEVKIRRVNNPYIQGNFTLIWAQLGPNSNTQGSSNRDFYLMPKYDNNMETFYEDKALNKGTDNLFDNVNYNKNNIERLDWIKSVGYATSRPARIGFAIFERGEDNAHDPFCIAAITSLDAQGNPASYGPIVRVNTSDYGNCAGNIDYWILKNQCPNNLLDATGGTQARGGVFMSLASLGIAANQTIYGYSIIPADLPANATPANLVNYNDTTFFPTNTGTVAGGLDLIGVTGIFMETDILPVNFLDVSAVQKDNEVAVRWQVAGEKAGDYYEVQRSKDGKVFTSIATISKLQDDNGNNHYDYADKSIGQEAGNIFYRIKQTDASGSAYYSKTLLIKDNSKASALILYPNPATNELSMQLYSAMPATGNVQITNTVGQIVDAFEINLSKGNNVVSIPKVQKLATGQYHLQVTNGQQVLGSQSFLKQ